MPRCLPILTPFFDRFLIGFYFQLGPLEPEKSSPRCSESTIFKKSPFEVDIDFWWILVPTCLHFPSQNPPKSTKKSIPRWIKFWIDFSTDFSSMLARFWRPTWSHVGHIFHPRAVQNGPQHPPKATKTAKSLKNFENDPQNPMGYPSRPRFSRFFARLNSNFAGLCESRCLFRAALYTSPPNTQSPANFHPLDILVQINPQSTWGPNKLARRYKGEAFYNIR